MNQESRLGQQSGKAAQPQAGLEEAQRLELARRREQAELAAAARRDAQLALAQEEAAAQERLRQLDERIESLLSGDPQEFVIRFLQTEGQ